MPSLSYVASAELVTMGFFQKKSDRMHGQILPFFIIFLLLFSIILPVNVQAGIELDCEATIKSWVLSGYYRSGECSCSAGRPVCGKSSGSAQKSLSRGNSSKQSMENDIKLQLFQGILDGFTQKPKNSPKSRQQQETQQETYRQLQLQRLQKESELEFARQKNFTEKKEQLLGTLKGGGTGPLADFKNLDGDAETMRKTAGDLFEQAPDTTGRIEPSSGTDFFGTTLSEPEIATLMEPENDPIIVDVTKASTFVVQSLKQNSGAIKVIAPPEKIEKKSTVEKKECVQMIAKYNRQIGDMQKFQKQLDFTKSQLDEWQQRNDAAFWNAVVDGASFAVGEFFDYLKETRSGAANMRNNLELIETRLINEKVYTPAQIANLKTKLTVRTAEYRIAKYSSDFGSVTDYFDYVKNVINSSVAEIGKTDSDIKEFLSNPKVKEYAGEFPAIDAAQFLAGKSMTALLTKKGISRFSYVGVAQLAVNTAYNATDMYLSYKNICTLRNAAGKELEAAQHIQSQLTDTYNKITQCTK